MRYNDIKRDKRGGSAMFTGINIYETRPYTSKNDPDKNNPTTFHIGLLDPILRAHLEDKSVIFEKSSPSPKDPVTTNYNVNIRNIDVVKFGLRGLDNFLDPQTKEPVKFDTISTSIKGKNYTAVSERIILMLGKKLIDELAEVILEENILSEDEEKN